MFECQNCQAKFQKWLGKCSNCLEWNSLIESEKDSKQKVKDVKKASTFYANDIPNQHDERIISSFNEWNSVLGGGIVPGAVMILTGDPGVGKSTMALQVSSSIATKEKVLYISSEESLSQLKRKLNSLDLTKTAVLFCEENDIDSILDLIKKEKPKLVIIDSIQNCSFGSRENGQAFFANNAIKEAVHELVMLAKKENIAIIITGHITKEGSLAGPKLLEHLVDAVFYLQDDKESNRKILNAVKNRFGPIDEVGFFEMGEQGLQEISDLNETVLNEQEISKTVGSCLLLSFKGSRCILTEIQSLCVKTKNQIPQRIISGIDPKKALIICALLEKYLKVELSNCDIFIKTKNGLKITETYSDLAIAIAIYSSYKQITLPSKCVAFGEINLSGKITTPSIQDKLVKNAKKLNIKTIISAATEPASTAIDCLEIKHLYSFLEKI